MKKGILYYAIVISLLLHLLAIFALRLDRWDFMKQEKKEKEPLIVDILGPVKHGRKTVLPRADKDREGALAEPKPAKPSVKTQTPPMRVAKAAPPAARPMPPARMPQPARPAVVSPPPMPAQRPSNPPAPRPGIGPEGLAPVPPKGGQGAPSPDTVQRYSPPQPAVQGTPGGQPSKPSGGGEAPRRLSKPTEEDMRRYAKADQQVQRAEPGQGITLDTTDLMYASYMQGLKNRIELNWKYPESAQRDGIQGDLVMRFTISKSGKVTDLELIRSSGYGVLDKAVKQALMDASPFNPLPDSWKKDEFVITGTFMYRLYGMYVR